MGYAYQALLMVVGLWLTPFLLHHIGQHDLGVWMVATQLLAYLALLDVGVVSLLPRETAYITGRAGSVEAARDLPILVGQMSRIISYQTLVAIAAMVVIWNFMPPSWLAFRGLIAVILATYAVVFPLRIFQALLQGLQDFKFLGRVQILSWVVSTGATVLLVLKGLGLYALVVGWCMSQFLTAGAAAVRLWTAFPIAFPRGIPPVSWNTAFGFLTKGFWVTISQLAVTLGAIDVVIISKLLGPGAVVPYSCTLKLAAVLWNQPTLIMQAAESGLSELRTGAPRPRVVQAVTALTQAILMLTGLIVCVVLGINRSFVSWWIGSAQYSGLLLVALYLLNMLLRHWSITASYSIFCFGYERRICFTTLLDGVSTAASSLLLIWWLGPIGGPLGMIVGVLFISLPLNLAALRRELGVSFAVLIAPLSRWLWRFLPIAGAAAALNFYQPALSFIQIAITAGTITLIYCLVMFGLAKDSTLGIYLMPRLNRLSMMGKRLLLARSAAEGS